LFSARKGIVKSAVMKIKTYAGIKPVGIYQRPEFLIKKVNIVFAEMNE